MLQWTDEQYGRVARYLDGQPVDLTGPERDLAKEITDGEVLVTGGIDVRQLHRAMATARRQMSVALARPRRRKIFAACFAAGEVVAAAAVLIIMLTVRGMSPPAVTHNALVDAPLEVISSPANGDIAEQILLVHQDIDLLEAEICAPAIDFDQASFEIDELQFDLEELMNYEPPDFFLEG